MKGIDLFCASPASTAICSSMDQRSMVRRATRPLDHHHAHHIGDRRKAARTPVPCSSHLPIDPKPYYHKSRKSSAKQIDAQCRRSSDDISDLASPPGSSRYLLSDTPFFSLVSDSIHSPTPKPSSLFSESDHVKPLVPSQPARPRTHLTSSNSPALNYSLLSNSNHITTLAPTQPVRPRPLQTSNDSPALKSASTRNQVVELRVSLHCKGCEGKVRKHISRMEGVTSYSIDLATKKVTVIGDVTPLGVLTSISRVKNAQFWPSPSSSSSPVVGLSY